MKVYFIRHGATKGNLEHRYVGRTDEGILDSEWERLRQTGNRLEKTEYIFTSPYRRCVQSARALFGERRQIEIIEDFREMDFGIFEYKNYEELNGNPDYQRFIDSGGTIAFPGGEEPEAFKARCRNAFKVCIEKACNMQRQQVAFVLHGGTIMAILESYGLPKQSYFDYQVKNGAGFAGEIVQEHFIQLYE